MRSRPLFTTRASSPRVILAELERIILARAIGEEELVQEAIVRIDRVLVAHRERLLHHRRLVTDGAPHVDEGEPPAGHVKGEKKGGSRAS